MTEVGEAVAIPGAPAKEEQLVDCEWKKCKKTHEKKPSYPKGGTVKRNSSYKADWVKANLEPWQVHGSGKDSKATLAEYQKETPAASYAIAASKLKHPEYHTQKHHLISVNLFDGVSSLSANAKLVGYDANHKNNGICLPSYVLDIVQHDLQCHRGSHPKALYNDKLKPLLANLDKRCQTYCLADSAGDGQGQAALLEDLNRISRRAENKIKQWAWLLRKNAKAERTQSKERYKGLR